MAIAQINNQTVNLLPLRDDGSPSLSLGALRAERRRSSAIYGSKTWEWLADMR